jgi:hypothetical protein
MEETGCGQHRQIKYIACIVEISREVREKWGGILQFAVGSLQLAITDNEQPTLHC